MRLTEFLSMGRAMGREKACLVLESARSDGAAPRYRYRVLGSAGEWLHASGEEDLSEIARLFPFAKVMLLVCGTDYPLKKLTFKQRELKHLARLVPFELEAMLASGLNNLIFATQSLQRDFKAGKDSELDCWVAFGRRDQLQAEVEAIEAEGFDVHTIVPIPALLPRAENTWHCLVDDEWVHFSLGGDSVGTIEKQQLPDIVAAYLKESAEPDGLISLRLYYGKDTDKDWLDSVFRETLVTGEAGKPEAEFAWHQIVEPWDVLKPAGQPLVNMRQGELERPIRWCQLWHHFRLPAGVLAAALLVYVLVGTLQLEQQRSRYQTLEQEIETAFRQVFPEGELIDPEFQLRTRLREISAGSSQSLMEMLSGLALSLSSVTGDITLHALRYRGSNGELQVNVSAPASSNIVALNNDLNRRGLRAQARDLSTTGGVGRASIIISPVMR